MTAVLADTCSSDAPLSVSRACRALNISRSTWYRLRDAAGAADPDSGLRGQIQRIALERPSYGYRRIAEQLKRAGVVANRKRVLRIMREDNLLCLRRRGYLVTTDSGHRLPVYSNLAKGLIVERANQLWVADITYIQLEREFVYFAVVLDVFSRRVIGWELGQRLGIGPAAGSDPGALGTGPRSG
jgi:putative transposase